ncbi:MAG: hypothetical protein PVG25_13080 [Anaerolineae bacterium]|jgi:hypothetical protein
MNTKKPKPESLSTALPVTRKLTLVYALSVLAALILAVASVAGLMYPGHFYPTEALRQSFLPNDVLNLVIGLPILVGSMWLARQGRLLGLLFWPGSLFYVLYNSVVYALGLPLNLGFLLWLVLLTLSAYTTVGLVASVDAKAVQRELIGWVPERLAGGILTGLGAVFSLRVIGLIVQGLLGQTPIAGAERALHVADLVISPALIVGGLLLWRREPLGYVAGTGLLFQASMLFIGLITILLLLPLLTAVPFRPVDTIVVFAMGLVCFVPFALFLRGVATRGSPK